MNSPCYWRDERSLLTFLTNSGGWTERGRGHGPRRNLHRPSFGLCLSRPGALSYGPAVPASRWLSQACVGSCSLRLSCDGSRRLEHHSIGAILGLSCGDTSDYRARCCAWSNACRPSDVARIQWHLCPFYLPYWSVLAPGWTNDSCDSRVQCDSCYHVRTLATHQSPSCDSSAWL